MITFTRKAEIALKSLDSREQEALGKWFKILNGCDPDEYIRTHIKKIMKGDNLYMLKATKVLRVIFTVNNNNIEILEIVKRARLEKILEPYREGMRT